MDYLSHFRDNYSSQWISALALFSLLADLTDEIPENYSNQSLALCAVCVARNASGGRLRAS